MRVLHVIPSVAPRYGGPSQAVIGFCRALQARGVETLIATTNADGTGVLTVPLGTPTVFEGVSAILFPRLGEAFKYSAPLARWLSQNVSAFDVVHIHAVFSHASLTAGRACRAHGVPYIVRPLGSLDPWSLSQGAWKKRVLLQTSARALIRGASAMHFTTADEQRLAAPVTASTDGAIIAPGVDDDLLVSPIEGRPRRVLALSRLDPKKRLEVVIRAFHKLADAPQCGDWQLTIAGDGDASYRKSLEALAANGPAASRISFPGWLTGDARGRALGESQLFVLPSHQENFGIGLLEAMASGVPAIVSSAVNLAPAVQSAGAGWVVDLSEDSFVSALQAAMTTDADRTRRAHAARQTATRYTWSASADALVSLYQSLRPVSIGAAS